MKKTGLRPVDFMSTIVYTKYMKPRLFKNSTPFEEILMRDLNSEEAIREYLNGAFELYLTDGDFKSFYASLEDVIKARDNIQNFARKTNISRASLYNIFKNKKEPKITTIAKILNELGFSLKVA